MKKIPIWKNVTLIVSVIVVMVIAAFAWFYSGTRGTAEDMVTQVGKAYYVQISDGGGKWEDDLVKPIGINRDFKEISGNGTDFYVPVYDVLGSDADEEGSEGFYTDLVSFEKLSEEKTGYYYEEVLEFRSDIEQQIYLSPLSYVVAPDSDTEDFICGAVRIAFFEIDKDGNETLSCIWAPNSTIEYSTEESLLYTDGNVEEYYCYQNGALSTAQIPTNGEVSGYYAPYKFMWSNAEPATAEEQLYDGQNLPEEAPILLSLDTRKEDSADIHYYKTMKVKVWLEGNDRECVKLLNSQKFKIKLEFTTKEVE